jgi:hypothetical protein
MARIEGLEDKQAPLVTRVLARVAKRKWGRVTEMMKITTHAPKVASGWAAFEMLFDRSTYVDRKLRKLAATKAAMQIGCSA